MTDEKKNLSVRKERVSQPVADSFFAWAHHIKKPRLCLSMVGECTFFVPLKRWKNGSLSVDRWFSHVLLFLMCRISSLVTNSLNWLSIVIRYPIYDIFYDRSGVLCLDATSFSDFHVAFTRLIRHGFYTSPQGGGACFVTHFLILE